jgi:DNA-directed RNA polymerase specialized sigma subunit
MALTDNTYDKPFIKREQTTADKIFEQFNNMSSEEMLGRPGAPVKKDQPLWARYQQGDTSVSSDLLKELKPTIDSAVKRFAGDDTAYTTQARILALNAVKTYDPSKKTALSSHVFTNLQRLQRISAQRGNLIHVPENAALQRRVIDKAKTAYEMDNGVEPTVEELADITGLSQDRIHKLSQYLGTTSDSMTVDDKGDSLVSAENKALQLYDRYIYDELDRIDKKIYEWSTGYGGAKIIDRASMAKKLGISQAAVSQRASKISAKFNQDRELIRKAFHAEQ